MKTIEEIKAEIAELKRKAAEPVLTPDEEATFQALKERDALRRKRAEEEERARDFRNTQLFEEVQSQHPGAELRRVDTAAGLFVLRPPSRPATRRWQNEINAKVVRGSKAKSTADATEDYVKSCIVYPDDEDAVEAAFDKYPLLATSLMQHVQELADYRDAEAEKK